MARSRTALSVLGAAVVLLAGGGLAGRFGRAGDPGDGGGGPGLDAAAAEALRDPMKDPEGVRAALARARALVTDRKALAEAMRSHGVEVEGAVGLKAEGWGGIEGGAAVGNTGGGVSAGVRDFKWKGGAGANDRILSSGTEVTAFVFPDGTRLKRVYQVGLEYADNRSYLEAMGLDAGNLPGMQTAQKLMRTALDSVAPAPAAPSSPAAPPAAPAPAAPVAPPAVFDAVRGALYDDLPPLFRAATKFSHYEVRSGWVIEDPTGKVSVSHVQVERRAAGADPGEVTRWEETSAGLDLDVELPVEVGKVGATGAVAIKWSHGKDVPPPSAEQRAMADAIERNDRAALVSLLRARLAPMLEPSRVREALRALDAAGKAAAGDVRRIVGLPAPEVGGVSLQYDPEMLATAIPPPEAARLLTRLVDGMAAGSEGFVVTGRDERLRLLAVSLRGLLDGGATTVGSLARLRGAVVDPAGDVLLLGEEDGDAPIDLDVLTVAARAIGKDGTWPYVSLDPDPADFAGPQRVRVGGVPDAMRGTAFVRTLLEADYAMKRIGLGVDAVDVEGFRSWRDHLAADVPAPGAATATRAWLVPMPSTVADVWMHRVGERRVILFDSRVQVLSEAMKRVEGLLVGTGAASPQADAAAADFTRCYDALAERRPVFRALAGAFDCAKLAAILARERLGHPLLDRLAARTPRPVEIPASYAGIGPVPVAGTSLLLSGGVEARVRLRAKDVRASTALAPLADAKAGAGVTATFPATVPLSGRDLLDVRADVLVGRALRLLKDDRPEEAEPLLARALEDDPSCPMARALRAVASVGKGDVEGALADVETVLPDLPETLGLRGLLRTLHGDLAGGKADADEALRRFPDDEAILGWAAETRLLSADFAGCEDLLARALARDPTNTGYRIQWTQLDTFHRLGPTQARERARLFREVPHALWEDLQDGSAAILAADPLRSVAVLSRALDRAKAAEGNPAVRALFLRERAEVLLSSAKRVAAKVPGVAGDPVAEARALLDGVAARHPDWITPRLLAISVAGPGGDDGAEAMLDRILAGGATDPLLDDFTAQVGSGRVGTWAALTVWRRATERGVAVTRLTPLLDRVIAACGEGVEGDLFRAIRAGLFHEKQAFFPLGERLRALPLPPDPDPVRLLAIVTAASLYLSAPPDPAARAQHEAVLLRFLEVTDVDELNPSQAGLVAMLRMACLMGLGEALAGGSATAERFERLRTDLVNARTDVATVRAALAEAPRDVARSLAPRLSPFAAGFVAHAYERKLPVAALQAAARAGARLLDAGSARERIYADVAAWEAEGAGPEGKARRRDAMLELLDQARRPADLHMLATVNDFLAAVERETPPGPEADRLALAQAKLQARLRGVTTVLRRRDWTHWSDPAPGMRGRTGAGPASEGGTPAGGAAPASASGAPPASGGVQSPPAPAAPTPPSDRDRSPRTATHPLLGAAATLAALAAFVGGVIVVRARRRRQSKP